MPSPTVRTVPVSSIEVEVSWPWICSRMMRLISSARISMSLEPSCGLCLLGAQRAAESLERGPHAAVEGEAAHVGHEAADQLGIDLGLEQHLLAGRGLERGLDAGLRGRVEGGGRLDGRPDPSGRVVGEIAIVKIDLLDAADAPALEHQLEELADVGLGADPLEDRVEHRPPAAQRVVTSGEHLDEVVLAR